MVRFDASEEARELIDFEQEYIKNGGTTCPRCKSQDITATDAIDTNGDPTVWQPCRCSVCDMEWMDYYVLTGIEVGPEYLDANDNLLLWEPATTISSPKLEKGKSGEYIVRFECGEGEEDCDSCEVAIIGEVEDGVKVIYFRAYDQHGRRGNVAVPATQIHAWLAMLEKNSVANLEYNEFGSLTIDMGEEYLYMSTGPHGDFSMPWGADENRAIFAAMEEIV